ncbi:PAAR domain-containing protein [Xenorhabdus bovienii]|uniref:PAAR domain-containing protein n=1 Tax=Xenorhabdus bovienii TaxID=40576 RepID=A0AAJ1N7J6_XENBV|nr:PAAR domain-containing protein [Xenorhabdus bovienii]MDE1480506.1 PAAR domain-containing protein [Xenorhabdus bovienii]MDE9434232.1 PAAR domain-containing protein [Xenorhabdus bovienii]MDE9491866.1 PAAR domain-containing protein [Xenorhabdus bovienii]MDE9508247.1 PAAR domain-containing protein [Xenorhabdus bovienii]MDE9512189.1 PAAR domain-containing protein [Xenorhabdus bovienii]
MSNKPVIRLNDTTDHGGKVITAIDGYVYQGIPIAGKGDLVTCPKCEDTFPIVEGSDSLKYQGKQIALEGMSTACGAKLIASQNKLRA